jgi:hypothetical protein
VAGVIGWMSRDGGEEVPRSDWWKGLPGTEWGYAEGPGERGEADRWLASEAVLNFYTPDLTQLGFHGHWGNQAEAVYKWFLDWLTPTETERQDPKDGFYRRRALIGALNATPPGTDPSKIVVVAKFLYLRGYKDVGMPEPARRPHGGRRRLRGVTVGA